MEAKTIWQSPDEPPKNFGEYQEVAEEYKDPYIELRQYVSEINRIMELINKLL
jgi:hypothetical protein